MQNNKVTFIRIGKRRAIRYREEVLRAFIHNSAFRSTPEYPEVTSHAEQ